MSLSGLTSKAVAQLHEDLMYWYLHKVRPVEHPQDVLIVAFGAYLIQIIDVVCFRCTYVSVRKNSVIAVGENGSRKVLIDYKRLH